MDVESLAKQLILKGMTEEQQSAVLESIKSTMLQARTVQKQRVGENVQVVVQALKKIEADIKARYDETGKAIEKRVASIKDGKDGQNGINGKDGRDGRPGRDGAAGQKGNDGLPGRNGIDGVDGVSVTNAFIDFDGSLIINLSNGQDLNVGEVVAPDLAEKIKVITNGGGTSQQVLDTLASLQTQINNLIPSQTGNAGKFLTTNGTVVSWATVSGAGGLDYQGTWNASTNTPTLASGVGINGYYYITATAGSTNLDGITDWEIGDWLIFNGTVWQKIDQSNLVTSVNGQTGAVSLTTTNINEGTNLYYTDARARAAISAGTGISYDSATGVVTNASPDQTVSLTASTGISTSGTYPNFTITNTAPDQTVSLTGAGTTSISGTYPNFTITSADSTVGTVTSVSGTGTVSGISLSGTVTSSGNLTLGGTLNLSSPPTIGNTAPNTGRFTTLTVDDNTTLGTSNSDTVTFNARINSDFDPATDNAFDLGRVGHEWRNLYIDGTANIDSLIADTADINAGTIDNTSIGASTASTGVFTTLTATNLTSTGTGANTMPVGTTAQRPASPQAGMFRLNTTTTEPEWYDTVDAQWVPFSTDVTPRSFSADFLVIAGGGAGGTGGGGAGGYRELTSQTLLPATNYTVTIGAGGTSSGVGGDKGGNGSNSVFSTITAAGGSGGGGNDPLNPDSGGSGGGAGYLGSIGSGNTPNTSPSQGNNGGNDQTTNGSNFSGGGGGGASAVGGDGTVSVGGVGGNGTASSITGTSVTRAGGGGGGVYGSGRTGGAGGTGGGGTGGGSNGGSGTPTAGSVNTGGGGGGIYTTAGAGGSGVVIVKYPDTLTVTNPGGGLTSSTASAGGFKVTTFTAGTGTVQFN